MLPLFLYRETREYHGNWLQPLKNYHGMANYSCTYNRFFYAVLNESSLAKLYIATHNISAIPMVPG